MYSSADDGVRPRRKSDDFRIVSLTTLSSGTWPIPDNSSSVTVRVAPSIRRWKLSTRPPDMTDGGDGEAVVRRSRWEFGSNGSLVFSTRIGLRGRQTCTNLPAHWQLVGHPLIQAIDMVLFALTAVVYSFVLEAGRFREVAACRC
jgi:hypothetical protein